MPTRWDGRWSTLLSPRCRRIPGSSFPGIPHCRSSRRSATGLRDFSNLAPLAGGGRIASTDAIRVRGLSAHTSSSEFAETAPHPNPLPAKSGAREQDEPMPLQNRVTPTGDIIATPHRGMFTGNRGIIHDPATKTLTRRWASQAWLTCLCEFRGWRRKVMGGRSWTELFFLDEATALAAGHRPCFFCRRRDAESFRAAWARGNGGAPPPAPAMDEMLHGERLSGRGKRLHPLPGPLEALPDGAMVAAEGSSY